MPVPTLVSQLSTTANSNSPSGADAPSVLDDHQRAAYSFIALHRDGAGFSQEEAVASASTADIGAASSFYVQITGTTTITSFGTNYNGPRFVRFAGILTLTHNATTLIIPGAANVTTAVGDRAILVPVGNPASGWQVVSYTVAALVPGAASSATSLSGTVAVANGGTGATTEAGARTNLGLDPLVNQTGDLSFKARTSTPAGWLKLNGDSIGSAASGGTARANADTEALFTLWWNDYPQSVLAIQTSAGGASTRGASAAADFAANKRLPLFDARGDAFRVLDESRGVDPARVGGSEQLDAFQGHAHNVLRTSDSAVLQAGGYAMTAGGVGVAVLGTGSDTFQGKAAATLGSDGTPRTAAETRMRNIAFPVFVKL